jgi:23S rRNA G2445 N2-methylase RlmL
MNIKSLIITNKGCEEAVQKELALRFGITKFEVEDFIVKFEVDSYETLIKICYQIQSAAKILIQIDEFEFKDLEDIEKQIINLNLSKFFKEGITFSSRTMIVDNSDLNRQECESEIGGAIIDSGKKTKTEFKVNLDDPDLYFYSFIKKNKCYFGIDFTGEDLSSREYKLFTGRDDLKGNVAFSLLMLADYKKEEKLLDPYMRNGIIILEGGLFVSDLSVNYYQKDAFSFRRFPLLNNIDCDLILEEIDKKRYSDKTNIFGLDSMLKNVKATQKNAKVAGILKQLNLTRADIEWLDTRFKEGEIDKIITMLPKAGRFIDSGKLKKEYDEFFHQARFVLNKNGLMVLISNAEELINECVKKYKFIINRKKKIWQGDLDLDVYIVLSDNS